eukprot:gene17117-22631_t
MSLVNQTFMRIFSGSFTKGLTILLIGYGFAWVGDFRLLYDYIISFKNSY